METAWAGSGRLHRLHPGDVIVPMTLHAEARHHQIFEAFRTKGVDACHVSLLASRATIRARLRTRLDGEGSWALLRFEAADSALRRPQFSTHIHTDRRALAQVVTELGSVLGRQLRYSPQELVQLPLRRAIVKVRHIR